MLALNYFYKIIDLLPKLIFRLRMLFTNSRIFTKTSKSDSDSTPYRNYVSKAIDSDSFFRKFRRNYSYRVILEHVDYELGKKYYEKLDLETIENYRENQRLLGLSKVGKPRTYYFKGIGWASPTVIRYLFVNQNLTKIFGLKGFENVAEIGVGFGGQLIVSRESCVIQSYSIYDLPEVDNLVLKVLNFIGADLSDLHTESIQPVAAAEYDLVISNYAFSELPREVQLEYVNKVLCRSRFGYLTMNSGRENFTGRSTGKMSLTELIRSLPGSEVLEEDPLTGPDNYILIWGHRK